MNVTRVIVRPRVCDVVQVRIDNLQRAEEWSGGQIKGTMLPPHRRVIEIKLPDGSEQEAKVGDWIVKIPQVGCRVYTSEELNQWFSGDVHRYPDATEVDRLRKEFASIAFMLGGSQRKVGDSLLALQYNATNAMTFAQSLADGKVPAVIHFDAGKDYVCQQEGNEGDGFDADVEKVTCMACLRVLAQRGVDAAERGKDEDLLR